MSLLLIWHWWAVKRKPRDDRLKREREREREREIGKGNHFCNSTFILYIIHFLSLAWAGTRPEI